MSESLHFPNRDGGQVEEASSNELTAETREKILDDVVRFFNDLKNEKASRLGLLLLENPHDGNVLKEVKEQAETLGGTEKLLNQVQSLIDSASGAHEGLVQ